MWKVFGCKTLADYHDLHLKTDVCLLVDVFENFRSICLKEYGLDLAQYYTLADLFWDAMLKKTGVQLELLTDVNVHTQGGISLVSKRYAEANNPHVKGYNPNEPTNYIQYLDANNFHGWAMSKPLDEGKLFWKDVMTT